MSEVDRVEVRLGGDSDVRWCAEMEPEVPEDLVTSAVSAKDVVVAERDGDLLGYLRLEWFWSRIPYIAMIRVKESFRGAGIGKQMLAFLEQRLIEDGHAFVLSSSTANEDAPQQWHRSAGFEECGFIDGLNENGVGETFFRKDL